MSALTLLRFDTRLRLATPWQCLAAWLRRMFRESSHHCPDAVALRDLGLDASEWSSVQTELAGRAAATRRRVVLVA
jgi:hypothetical protein